MTLPELCERLKMLDEVLLIELLGLTSETIVNAFPDIIEDNADYLIGELEEHE